MNSIYVWFLLGLFCRVESYKKGEAVYGDYLLQYWDGGDDYIEWCDAEQACVINSPAGGTLVMPKSKRHNDEIIDLLEYWGSPKVWLGGNDIHTHNYWMWVDGTVLWNDYTNWIPNEPNNKGGYESCLEMYPAGNWNDNHCESNRGYVCQSELSRTTKSDFVALSFSDSFSEESKSATSVDGARIECGIRGLKLAQDFRSNTAKKYLRKHLLKFTKAEYCIDDEEHDRMIGIDGIIDQKCTSKPFLYICEGYRPHYIKVSDKKPVVEKSGNLEIECTADGYPVPDVTWHKNYDHVITSDVNESIHQTMIPGKSTLVIENAKQGDADRYRCYATNNINEEEHSVRINVDLEVTKNEN